MLMIYIITIIHGIFWLGLLKGQYSTLLLLEMPLVFLVSGYAFSITSIAEHNIDPRAYLKFIASRATRILIPYWAYATACMLLSMYLINDYNWSAGIRSWLNPFNRGNGFTAYYLNLHLWFIPTYLLVSLALPLLRLDSIKGLHWRHLLASLCAIYLALWWLDFELATVVFYLIWALLGYFLGKGTNWGVRHLFGCAAGGIFVLAASFYIFHGSLDMQSNKFPPNPIFLAFSLTWVSLALIVAPKIPQPLIYSLASHRIIKIFISSGYSMYLWQGLGYTLASIVHYRFGLDIFSTWLFAIAATIAFGSLAAPLERLRWKQV
jgi:peptidoglycan/LPS O-acetylase OafA/YrhL